MEQSEIRNPKSEFLSRRGFIQTCFACLVTARAGVLVQNRLFPMPAVEEEAEPVEVPLEKVTVDSVKHITYGGKPALIMRSTELVYALLLVCTHLGCDVEWQPDRKEFFCPCHDGWFDQFGNVLGGPPPVPLERLPVEIEGDKIIVGET